MTTLLDLPSKKIFIRDLKDCQRSKIQKNDSEVKKFKEWQINCLGKQFQVSVVWIQGTVVQVEDDSDTVYVDDSTAVAKVAYCNKIPFLSQKLKTGQYVMVIGQIISPGSNPMLRAIKVQNLSHMVDMETSWNLEVMDQRMLVM